MIKAYKSVSRGKKVYLLASVEPSVEVTGGLSGARDFDFDRIVQVCDKVEAHVRRQGSYSHRELLIFIK